MMPAGALGIWYATQYDALTNSILNRQAVTPERSNLVAFTTGVIYGNDGLAASTQFYANGPTGKLTAKRLQIAASGDVHDFFYFPTSRVLPAGTYTLAFALKGNTGTGTRNFKYGVFFTGSTGSVTDAAWTTYSVTFVSDGVAAMRLGIYGDGISNLDVLLDELQLYVGTVAPAFSAELIAGHARAAISLPSTITISGAAIDTTSIKPLVVQFAPPETPKNFSEGTIFAVVSTEIFDQTAAKVLCAEGNSGLFDVGINKGRPYGLPAYANNAHAGDDIKIAGKGYRIIGSRFKAGDQTFFFHNIPYAQNTATLTAFSRSSFGMFGDPYGLPTVIPGNFPFKGKSTALALYDKWLSDAEVDAAVKSLTASHAQSGEAAIQPFNLWIAEGDSITQSTSFSAHGQTFYYSFFDAPPNNTWFGKNVAVGGSTLAGGFTRLPIVLSQIRAALASGNRPIVTCFFGANAIPTLDDLKTYWAAVRNAGGKIVAFTILPLKQDSTFEATRLARNTEIRGASAFYDALVDLGGDATIGSFAAPGVGTAPSTYYADGVHLNAAGNAIALPLVSAGVLSQGL